MGVRFFLSKIFHGGKDLRVKIIHGGNNLRVKRFHGGRTLRIKIFNGGKSKEHVSWVLHGSSPMGGGGRNYCEPFMLAHRCSLYLSMTTT